MMGKYVCHNLKTKTGGICGKQSKSKTSYWNASDLHIEN